LFSTPWRLIGATQVSAAPPSTQLARSPALLVLCKAENSLAILDGDSLKLIGRVPTGEEPHEVVASPDGRFAFVTNYGSDENPGNSISIIDLGGLREVRRLDLGALARPHGITESGGKIYFTAEGSYAVARYDPDAQRVDAIIGTGQTKTHMLAVARGSKKVFTANAYSNSVTTIERDETTGSVKLEQIPVGTAPEGLDLSPDERELWVAQLGDGGISIIDTSANRIKRTLKAGGGPIRLKFTRDGRQVLVSDLQSGELLVLNAETGRQLRRIPVGAMPIGILVSPDGRRAFVSLATSGSISVVNLGSLSIERTLKVGQGPDGMAWAAK